VTRLMSAHPPLPGPQEALAAALQRQSDEFMAQPESFDSREAIAAFLVAALRSSGWDVVPSGEVERLRAVEAAARFRASAHFRNLDPQPEGPDLLVGVAAYMDRRDDEDEARVGVPADRTVQAEVRHWADQLRAALAHPTDAAAREEQEPDE
jgi:hypothetical protein